MLEKRLLYFISGQVHAYRWKGGRLSAEALFRNNEQGVAEFAKWVQSAPRALYYVLADVVEEDFHLETLPFVRGRDRRTLVERKLAQRYRDLSLALALSLGHEVGARREERVLFSSFTNTQQFHPWLAALSAEEAKLAGVYSVPLVSPLAGQRLGFASKSYLLVSLQLGGLRQTFVDNGQVRFSRLGQSDFAETADVARAAAQESARIQQYLVNMRILGRDVAPLEVFVLAPAEHVQAYRAACTDTPQLRFHVLDLDAACKRAGLRQAPAAMLGEKLFMQLMAAGAPSRQFADDVERRFYNVWRAKWTLIASGAALFAACALVAGYRMLDVASTNQLAALDRAQEARLQDQYAKLQVRFPKTPTTPDNLKALVKNYDVVQKQTASLNGILSEVSQALALSPQLDIDRIEWHAGADPRKSASGGAAKSGAPPAQPGAAAKPPAEMNYQVVEISGRVNVAKASDYRNITLLVNQFVEALRKRPGMEVFSAQLPFDINAEKSLSGDIGVERPTEVPRFTIVAAKRLGA